MQLNLRDGPPSTWPTHRVDGDRDGATDPYDPADAIASAAHYLRALLDGDVRAAVYGYNHSSAYVADVLARDLGWTRACRRLGRATRVPAGARDPVRRL